MVELRGFEPARHVLARTTPAIHFNTSNLSKSTGFCKTSVLWWSYGDSNPRGMPSQEQRRRSTSIISIYKRVLCYAKPLYYGGATGSRTREACPRKNNAGDPLQYFQSIKEYRVLQNLWTLVELRGFEPARHDLARTTPAIHFNYLNLSMSTRFCKTTVLWWSYGDSNPRGMSSQEQRRRSTSILPIYQRVQGSAKPLYYGGATGIRTREACPRKNNAGDPLQYFQSIKEYKVLQNHCTMVELRGFEPATHVLASSRPAIHFNTSNLSKYTCICTAIVLWWSYGDSNPRGMSSQEQRRRSTSILPIYQRVQGSAKPLYYGGATGIRTPDLRTASATL